MEGENQPNLEHYEEYERFPQWLGWLLVVALAGCVVGWALVLHMTIPELPRTWDFGATPDVPAESIYSSYPPPQPQPLPPYQVQPLPEGTPWSDNKQPPRSTILEKHP
ncbi:MAG: hypothetical protein NTZ09_11390 [Candidatus Hydrogenedentes bacterium]|jgi:hypothetical protein|nr:hypothetical protein [Candidatus Hydrogenedentota bacterium]